MYKSCKYCGGIHSEGYECPMKPKPKDYKKDITDEQQIKIIRFRNCKAWRLKRDEIKDRDKYLCPLCLRKLYNSFMGQFVYQDLQVHHIVPLAEDYSKRLDDDNLITLCTYHHALAERGDIPRDVLLDIVKDIEVNGINWNIL